MNNQEKNKIVEWLYVNDGRYSSKNDWRKNLLSYLDSLVDVGKSNLLGDALAFKKAGTGNSIAESSTDRIEKKWTLINGIIYLTVTSDGTTGKDWIEHLERTGFKIGEYAKQLLKSKDFKPTTNVKYKIAILKTDKYITTQEIRDRAETLGFKTPNAEIACLIRELLSDEDIKELGLWSVATFHKPIKDSDGVLLLLNTTRSADGSWLHASYGLSGDSWDNDYGFAFEVSQVSL